MGLIVSLRQIKWRTCDRLTTDLTILGQILRNFVNRVPGVLCSLLPFALHPDVAKLCIKCRVNMVTASYLSPAMAELDVAYASSSLTSCLHYFTFLSHFDIF